MTMTTTPYDECLQRGHVPQDAANPRLQHLCGRCGRVRQTEVPRDLDAERRWVLEAAEFAQYVHDPENAAASLNAYRERRMGQGPWRDWPRDFIRESEEEVVDLANYLCGALQELGEDRDDEDAAKCQMLLRMALGAAVTAYAALAEYRRTDL
jgi:hypothetical protein